MLTALHDVYSSRVRVSVHRHRLHRAPGHVPPFLQIAAQGKGGTVRRKKTANQTVPTITKTR